MADEINVGAFAMTGTWSDVFRRTRMTRYVWRVDPTAERTVWEAIEKTGVPIVRQSAMFSNAYTSAPLLDGVVIGLQTYGMPTMPGGTRVVGPSAMRWLCHQLDVREPSRRLPEETAIPSQSDLEAALAQQQTVSAEALRDRAALGVGVSDRTSLIWLVRELFGEEAVPQGPNDPAQGRMGEAGFLVHQADAARTAGLTEQEALRRAAHGLRPDEIVSLGTTPLQDVRPWLDLGMDAVRALELNQIQASLAMAEEMLSHCRPPVVHDFLVHGKTTSDLTDYLARGVPCDLAGAAVRADIPPDDASRWNELGFRTWDLAGVLRSKCTLQDARAFAELGLDASTTAEWCGQGFSPSSAAPWVAVDASAGLALILKRFDISPALARDWIDLHADPATVEALLHAGITAAEARRQWRKGRRRAETIIANAQTQ